jgi:hypothetical protein
MPMPMPMPMPTTTQSNTSQSPPASPISRNCRAPPQPENGHWQLHRSQCPSGKDCDVPEGTELQLGSYLIYSCNSGYKLNGSSDVSCSFEGRWLNIPVCSGIKLTIIWFLEHVFEKREKSRYISDTSKLIIN